ncbi:MAG: hypothetical protein HUU01_13550 [Saprospiraceae bacterium]|nr:hypothetical protein [Saprospiraceae bacterium]
MFYSLNLHPPLLATMLTEVGEYPQEAIAIRPIEGIPGPSLQEIMEMKPEKKGGGLTINIHSKSAERLVLEREIPETETLRLLVSAFEKELTFFQIEKTLRERSHLLGLSPRQAAFFADTAAFDEQQKNILAFFLPYGSQIQGDMVLMERCLQAALNMAVKLEMKVPRRWKTSGASVGNCILDSGAAAGGICTAVVPCLLVKVGPVPLETLNGFVPGARWRHFLENALLPLFVPNDWDWKIQVSVAPDHQIFCISEPTRPLCAGINTIVQ